MKSKKKKNPILISLGKTILIFFTVIIDEKSSLEVVSTVKDEMAFFNGENSFGDTGR